jgi:hypothetical protein
MDLLGHLKQENQLLLVSAAGAGTQTASCSCLVVMTGGNNTASTEEYNGSSWGPGGNLGTARQSL